MGLITLIVQINYSKNSNDYLRVNHQKFTNRKI